VSEQSARLPGGSLASTDPERFLERLAEAARRALQSAGDAVGIERERSLGDRLTGRPGRPVAIRFSRGERTLTLRRDGARWVGEAAHVVTGVTISRRTLSLGEWLEVFAGAVAVAAADAAGDAAAAGRALTELGLQTAEPEFAVSTDRLDADLRSLPERARTRLPTEAVPLVSRIAALLLETAPRVAGDPEAEALVRRTATVYLPDTLRAFVALPPDWARSRTLLDGTAPVEALLAQLANLAEAAERMRDASVADDAHALLLNGLFLEQRFGGGPDAPPGTAPGAGTQQP
jgi:hypothetical protein